MTALSSFIQREFKKVKRRINDWLYNLTQKVLNMLDDIFAERNTAMYTAVSITDTIFYFKPLQL